MLTLDSNLLVYALDTGDQRRMGIARTLVLGAASSPAFLTQQAIGEFCNVVLRKRLLDARAIGVQVGDWANNFLIVPTLPPQLVAAARLAQARRKQFWDMVIVRVAADAGATVLFTEDIGDGEIIEGVRIVNPFNPTNDLAVAALLAA